jgi:probable metal-binding protein
MSESVHGHDVMHMMLELGGQFTRNSLKSAIEARFGAATYFHTCSAEGMTAEQLIDFLEAKGKFVAAADGFNTREEHICQH